jgi:hypothetical protein
MYLDDRINYFQPYVTMAKGNATAEESVLLDYVRLQFIPFFISLIGL